MKKLISFIIAAIMFIGSAMQVSACTGVIVGKKVSADGSMIFARTEDEPTGAYTKLFVVNERKEYKDGEMFEDEITGFKYPQPKVSFKYTSVPDSQTEVMGIYDAVGFNEYGVSVTATISAYLSEGAQAADPLVENGLREANATTLVLSRVKTAKEGVKLLADIVEEQGSAEGNIVIIADKTEMWYMEILSGHRFAAVKVPDDVVAVIPNRFMLGYVDLADEENVFASPDLISFAKENGFYEEYNGKFHAALSYGAPLIDYDCSRLWGGQNFLAPSMDVPYDQEVFELFFKPDKKISVKDVMELQRYRYEGTEYDGNLPENKDVRVIGIERQGECHIVQIKDNLPREVGGVLWLAMGNSEHTVYLPTYGNITDTHKAYQLKTANYNAKSAYWIFRSLSTLAELDRERYGASVREYWSDYQDKLIVQQDESDKKIIDLYAKSPQTAAKYATVHAKILAADAIGKAQIMFDELLTYVAADGARTHEEPEPFVPSLSKASGTK